MAKTSPPKDTVTHSDAKGLGLIAISLLALLALISFDIGHPSTNWLGLLGHYLAFGLSYTFGLPAFAVVAFSLWAGWKLLSEERIPKFSSRLLYFGLFIFSASVLLNIMSESGIPYPSVLEKKIFARSFFFEEPYPHRYYRRNAGGVITYFFYKDLSGFNLERLLGTPGMIITCSITLVTSSLLFTGTEVLSLLRKISRFYSHYKESRSEKQKQRESLFANPSPSPRPVMPASLPRSLQPLYPEEQKTVRIRIAEEKERELPVSKKETAIRAQKVYNGDFKEYVLPPLSLLSNPKKNDNPSLKKELKRQAEILEETLMSFGIEAKVGDIHCGPTIASFEVHPAVGVKVQKITALENDIALNLQAKSIRIIAPIPGKAAVGVEIPSLFPQEVSFKEMLATYQQQGKKMHIPVLLGKTVSGEHLVSDLARMPHCIIAGATGSGKSVCINTLVMSVIMNAKPDEIKLLLVDPKKVELTGYTNLPHLLAPVITEPHGAHAALNWLVKEMTSRYEILRRLGVRNIHAFNNRVPNKELESSLEISVPATMFSIVAVIDEFADLMMVSGSDLETPIARIAQMARAVGIHLVLATQRPSREVITGLIKANFPTRIAFKVASRVNSQIILDETGAESLLGNGDMLFLPPGSSQILRAQGVYISDEEIKKVVSFVCDQAPAGYLISSFDDMKKEEFSDGEEEPKDMLYEQAKSIVLETNTASTTFLQRKLKVGYARAASLIDELESKGVIGPQEGSRPRKIFKSSGKASQAESEDF